MTVPHTPFAPVPVTLTFPVGYKGWPLALLEVFPGQFVGYVGQVSGYAGQGYVSPVYSTALAALADVLCWCDQHDGAGSRESG